MDFLVLGPLEVRREGEVIEVRGSKRRALLALLVVHANEVVRTDRLVDELWGESPPENALAALQSHVHRLRKDLGEDVLGTRAWGYVLRADPMTIDLRRAEDLVAEARTLAAHERRAKLGEALALWRGPALADLAQEPALASEAARLDELQLSTLEQRIDVDLELGGAAEVVGELESLVSRHPARERLRGQLILALYRSGRQAEALETYRETRRMLVDELGIEPSAELRELERAILRQDPSLTVAAAPPELGRHAEEEISRWRWPRSPLIVSAGVLLMAAAGAAAAVLLTQREQPQPASAATVSSPARSTAAESVPSPTTIDNKPPTRTVVERAAPRSTPRARRPRKRPGTPHAPSKPPPPPPPATPSPSPSPSPAAPSPPPATPPPPKKPATPTTTRADTMTWVYELTDNFTDPAFDHTLWHVATTGTGITVTEQNGRTELSVTPDVIWDTSSGGADTHLGTQCLLTGDFDATVEYELLEWPDADGMFLNFGVYMRNGRDTTWAFIGRGGKTGTGSSTESYASEVGSSKHWPQTADTAGALRLKRKQGTLTTFYRYRGAWVPVSSGRARGAANLILGLAAGSSTFGGQAARAAFDNFHATALSVDCSGYPLPPRKKRP